MRHGSVLPSTSILCLAPTAACSCFSTADIFASSPLIVFGAMVLASGYVEVSFSYRTMSSTSTILSNNLVSLSSNPSMTSSRWFTFCICVLLRSF